MMSAIRFRAFPDAAPALAELRGLGLKLVCVSNWDVSLPEVLERCGLDGALDGVVTSARGRGSQAGPGHLRARPGAGRLRAGRGALRRRHAGRRPGGGARRGHPRPPDRPRGRRGHRLAPGHPALSRPVSDSGLSTGEPGYTGAAWSGPAGDQPRTWGPERVAGGIGALLLTTVFEVAVVSAFDPELDSLAARLVLQALLAVTLVGIAFAVAAGRAGGVASPRALGLRRPLRSRARLGGRRLSRLHRDRPGLLVPRPPPAGRRHARPRFRRTAPSGRLRPGMLIVIAAPFSEEIFFRGFIFGGLRNRLSFPVAAVFSGVIFGLFHYTGPDSIAVVPQLALFGFALAWLYEETGSIYPPMAVHAVNNALAFAILTS